MVGGVHTLDGWIRIVEAGVPSWSMAREIDTAPGILAYASSTNMKVMQCIYEFRASG